MCVTRFKSIAPAARRWVCGCVYARKPHAVPHPEQPTRTPNKHAHANCIDGMFARPGALCAELTPGECGGPSTLMLYHAASASSEVILSRSPTTASSKLFFTPTGGPAPGNASASTASAVSYASCTRAYAARSSSRSFLKSSEERSSSSTRSARRRFASCSVSLRWSAADLPVQRGRLCKVCGDSAGASPCHDTTGPRRSEADRWLVSEAARCWLISTVRLLASCEVSVRARSMCVRRTAKDPRARTALRLLLVLTPFQQPTGQSRGRRTPFTHIFTHCMQP